MKKQIIITALVTIGLSSLLPAANSVRLEGRHQLTFSAGVATDGDNFEYSDSTEVGNFEYAYWLSESLAFNVKIGGMTPDWDGNCHYRDCVKDDIGIAPMLIGIEYRPEFLNVSSKAFFSINASVGPHVGVFESEDSYYGDRHHRYDRTDEITRVGAYFGGKFTVVFNSGVTLGAFAGYHHIEEFDVPVYGKKDFSSPDIGITFGYLF